MVHRAAASWAGGRPLAQGALRRPLPRIPVAPGSDDFDWTAVEHRTDLPARVQELHLTRCEEVEVMEEVRGRFTDRWLRSADG